MAPRSESPTTEAISPCPHCGATTDAHVVRLVIAREFQSDDLRYVACDYSLGGCGATGPMRRDPAECVAGWNRRSSSGAGALQSHCKCCKARMQVSDNGRLVCSANCAPSASGPFISAPEPSAKLRHYAARSYRSDVFQHQVIREEIEGAQLVSRNMCMCAIAETAEAIAAALNGLTGFSHEPGATQAARDVLAERQRQISREGWTPEHDDAEHCDQELAKAASVYANPYPQKFSDPRINHPIGWPAGWDYKPKDRRSNLVRAGALIVAEIERLDRASSSTKEEKHG